MKYWKLNTGFHACQVSTLIESQAQTLQKDGDDRLFMCGRTLSEGMRARLAGHSCVQTGILQLPPLLPHAREAGGASGFLAAGLAGWMTAFAWEGGERR